MIKFREWLKLKEIKKINLGDALEAAYFFESFNTHYDIAEIKKVDVFTFYGFSVNNNPYRIFIEDMPKYDMIHIGFEKYDFNERRWRIEGIDNELKNGEVQKIFGTIIYVVKDLYKGVSYNNILFGSDETKKFRVYLRLVSQISKKLIPDSVVSHTERSITITKEIKPGLNLSEIKTKYKPKK
jgi:hypothetical protein